jgi:methionine synthase I (cobalamin-dependent)
MSDRLSQLLENRPWLLADGATGTNYFALGLATGDAPELWNETHPDRVRRLHREFVEAGADIILTNSFGGSRHRLKLHGAADRVSALNRRAAELAREVADAARREVRVGGDIGPTGELFEPLGPLTIESGTAAFAEQAEALAEGGADLLWIETMSSVDELRAAVAGAGRTGLPIVCTLSFDTNGRTMMGVTPAELARLTHELSPRPRAYGANCGVGPAELVAALVNMVPGTEAGDVIVAKANCGIPHYVDGEIQYSGTPELMARYAVLAHAAGARIIGGCCGTTPQHVQAMRAALEQQTAEGTALSRPDLATVVDALGSISAGAGGAAPGASGRRTERSRRRRL